MEPTLKPQAEPVPGHKSRNNWWLLPLALPYLGLLFPQTYTRSAPALLGFPFFYWYQLGWVILASSIMGVVYHKLKS